MPKQTGRNSGFELCVLIQHIDLKDSHAWNALIPLSEALVSRLPKLSTQNPIRKALLILTPAINTNTNHQGKK